MNQSEKLLRDAENAVMQAMALPMFEACLVGSGVVKTLAGTGLLSEFSRSAAWKSFCDKYGTYVLDGVRGRRWRDEKQAAIRREHRNERRRVAR